MCVAGAGRVQAAGVGVPLSRAAAGAGSAPDQRFVSPARRDGAPTEFRGDGGSAGAGPATAGQRGVAGGGGVVVAELRRGGGARGTMASAADQAGATRRGDRAFRSVAGDQLDPGRDLVRLPRHTRKVSQQGGVVEVSGHWLGTASQWHGPGASGRAEDRSSFTEKVRSLGRRGRPSPRETIRLPTY